jgi:hypothetical protein
MSGFQEWNIKLKKVTEQNSSKGNCSVNLASFCLLALASMFYFPSILFALNSSSAITGFGNVYAPQPTTPLLDNWNYLFTFCLSPHPYGIIQITPQVYHFWIIGNASSHLPPSSPLLDYWITISTSGNYANYPLPLYIALLDYGITIFTSSPLLETARIDWKT